MGGSSCNGVRQSGPGNEDDNNENELKCFLPLRFNPDLVLHVEQERFWPPLLLLGCSRVERSLLVLKKKVHLMAFHMTLMFTTVLVISKPKTWTEMTSEDLSESSNWRSSSWSFTCTGILGKLVT